MSLFYQCSKGFRVTHAGLNFHSTTPFSHGGIRGQLLAGVKQAMKNKDRVSSIALRSVLSEVYYMDKATGSEVSSSVILGVLRKAVLRRTESASEFMKGERPDLAEKETREVEIISAFLPPMLSGAEIERVLKEVASGCPQHDSPQKVLGLILKSFYCKVDKANVDPDLVKSRAEMLLNAPTQ